MTGSLIYPDRFETLNLNPNLALTPQHNGEKLSKRLLILYMRNGAGTFAQRLRRNLLKNDPETVNAINEILLVQLRELIGWVEECRRHAEGCVHGCAVVYGAEQEHKKLITDVVGARLDKELFRLDISLFTSEHPDNLQKNLEQLFMNAEEKEWILFLDEADTLFAKRSQGPDMQVKYQEQDTSWLAGMIDAFRGLIIISVRSAELEPYIQPMEPGISLTLPVIS